MFLEIKQRVNQSVLINTDNVTHVVSDGLDYAHIYFTGGTKIETIESVQSIVEKFLAAGAVVPQTLNGTSTNNN